MKKRLFLILLILSVIFGGNFFLRGKHIKEIESSLNKSQKKLSDWGITFGISKITPSGKFFWDVKLNVEAEIYGSISDSILYFYIPSIAIHSIINLEREVAIDIKFPDEITGHLDMNREVADKMNLENKYKVFLKSKNIPIGKIKKESFDGNGVFNMDLDKVMIDIEGKKPREKLIFIENLNVNSKDLTSDETYIKTKIHDMNVYLDPEKFSKNLPKSISFDDGSKNIEWELNLLIADKVITNGTETVYRGDMDCITRAFEIKIDGEDRAIKPNNNRKYHKSDLNFNVKNFDNLADYFTSLMLNSKETELDRNKLIEASDIFRKTVKQHSRKDGDITSFRIKDTDDKKTLFEGEPIDQVFSEFIEKAKD